MKVAITGHTSGIGKSLFESFDDIIGLSRANGYNINDIDKIINAVVDSDVFINNAYDGFAQVDLLYNLWDKWQHLDKIIVCISSRASDYVWSKRHVYATHKKALDTACKQLNHIGDKCKVVCIKPGYINDECICEKELAQFIHELIVNQKKTYWIPEITFYPMIR